MERRDLLLSTGAAIVLAGCGDLGKVAVTMPAELKALIDDANTIIAKAETIAATVPAIAPYVAKAKEIVAELSGLASLDSAKPLLAQLVELFGNLASNLPGAYGLIGMAIETLLPLFESAIGSSTARRRPTGMSLDQARAVLRS